MRQGGRPRRSEEQPDSPFGKRLKEHVRRGSNFTQAELSRETLVSEKELSRMIKGKRTSGNTLRRDLREIVKVLFRKNALDSLEEANALFTAIPTIKELDERNQEDAEVIALFGESAPTPITTPALSPESTSVSPADLLPASPSLPVRIARFHSNE